MYYVVDVYECVFVVYVFVCCYGVVDIGIDIDVVDIQNWDVFDVVVQQYFQQIV